MSLQKLSKLNKALLKNEAKLDQVLQKINLIHNSSAAEASTILPKLSEGTNGTVLAPIGDSLVDYNHFINDYTKRRKPSEIRELNKLYGQQENIPFAGGLPSPSTFPFEEISVRLKDGTNFNINGKPLDDSLQYIPTQGYPPLLKKLKELQLKKHAPPLWDKYDVIITPGSQDALCKAVELSLEPGEPMLTQHPVYTGANMILKPFNADLITVQQDQHGLRPDLLRKAIEKRWKPHECFIRKRGVPKLLYVNPTAANPTGGTLTTERKEEIYRIACEYNLLILEDDPYYYLHFHEKDPVSLLSLDTEGRVIRLDSFSKILSAGLRLGFATGPKELIKKIELQVQTDSLHTSSLSQVLVDKTLESWGDEKLEKHFKSIQTYYKEKRDIMVAAAEKHLTGLAEWNVPTAGMFLWIKVKGVPDVKNLVTNECMKRGVLFVTGHAFMLDDPETCTYLRACYTMPSPEKIDIGLARLADAIRDEQAKYSLAS